MARHLFLMPVIQVQSWIHKYRKHTIFEINRCLSQDSFYASAPDSSHVSQIWTLISECEPRLPTRSMENVMWMYKRKPAISGVYWYCEQDWKLLFSHVRILLSGLFSQKPGGVLISVLWCPVGCHCFLNGNWPFHTSGGLDICCWQP